ncbi:MAG TPA: dihydroorotate dehydrogenase electron transfer subunit [Syntrophales bacterium]|jgi:dihydroorotate dehydrogenase electron transfer subunit|nr:dihydroorotate dehydrogenase electron transfer subunit [Syntrophales bacterium]HPX54970.1 dihydroorotate dehydrogenase electron transfer subunit [Syntrophales bacterium]
MEKKLNLGSGCVIENVNVAKDHFVMSLLLTSICKDALPGQFVMIRKQGVKDPLLSRPLSLYGVYQTDAGTVLEFLYRVVGKGTWALSRLTGGDQVDILGPLGKPFEILPDRNHVILLAGGIGVAPLSYFAEYLAKDLDRPEERGEETASARKVSFYLGATTAAALVGIEKIERFCTEVRISTDDGSAGFAGTVTELLQQDLAGLDHRNLCLYSCGPAAMIRSLSQLIESLDIPCQVSMEERMACGIGACLGCSIKVRDASLGWSYCQVCADGPVFDIKNLLWE